MPVRSRGSLLAGTVTLAGLLLAGVGCHSNPSDVEPEVMSGNSAPPAGGLFSRRAQPVLPVEQGQPVVQPTPAPNSASASGPVTLQPVPAARSAGFTPEVIASSWQPVQRVSAEQPVFGPELNGNLPTKIPPAAAATPNRAPSGAPVAGMASRMPAGSGPGVEVGEGNVLPAPRPLAESTPPAMVAHAGPMPPMHDGGQNMPREFDKMALPPYVVEPPDILLIQASDRVTLQLQRIEGQHLVTPDGTVNLGIYGKVRVVGMTLDQVADAVAARLLEIMPGLARGQKEIDPETGKETKTPIVWRDRFSSLELIKKEMQVDVLSYASKYYYVITDGGGYGQQVYPFVITGNETVLDAVARINGLPAVASKKKIWVARATRPGQPPKIFPVDWCGLAMRGEAATNYQLFPGDRVFVQSDGWIRVDTWLAKRLSPYLRGVGATLLTASTVNTIKNGGSSGAGLGSAFGGIR